MTTDRTDQTITLKDSQVRSKPDSCNPDGWYSLHIHLCCCKIQYHDKLNISIDHDSDGFD